jgi:membrane protease YdiL (CAAX protease family)
MPALRHGHALSKTTGMVMFPVMLLGPSSSGIVLTWLTEGRQGLADLFRRMGRVGLAGHWYLVLFIPPGLVLTTLLFLKFFFSAEFAPNNFFVGALFGIPAGFFEEIGWTGFAFPKMQSRFDFLRSALILGLLWAAWHLPVINYLGAAVPHGSYWLAFFLAFAFAMTAMRVLISWLYASTKSVLLAQLMHVSSTGALVVFSPAITAAQEVMWYAIYGFLLWVLVAVLGSAGQFAAIAGTATSVQQIGR